MQRLTWKLMCTSGWNAVNLCLTSRSVPKGPVHCYKPYYRQQIREVMRCANFRMFTHAPGSAMRHLWLMVKPDSLRVKQIHARMEK